MSDTVVTHIALVLSITTIIFNAYRFGYSRGERNVRRVLRAHPAHPHSADIAAARRRRAARDHPPGDTE